MIIFLRKTGMFVVRSTLTVCALLFIALIALQIILVAGVNLIASGGGSDFLNRQANKALQSSGYNVAFDALYYDPVRGFSIHDFVVSDSEGVFLRADKFSVGAYFSFTSPKAIDIHARGGNILLERFPASGDETIEDDTQTALQPFEIPDLYFNAISISNLSFDSVTLGPQIAGAPYTFSPSLKARLLLNDKARISLEFKPGLPAFTSDVPSPDIITADGDFSPPTLNFSINKIHASSSDYHFNAEGEGNLGNNGSLDLSIDAAYDALSTVTADAFSRAEITASLIGPLATPAINAEALAFTKNLKDRGLSDIRLSVASDNIAEGVKGNMRAETKFKDAPVTLETAFSYADTRLSISDIKGTAPSISITGAGTLSTKNSIFEGDIVLRAQDLARYTELAGIPLSGNLMAEAKLRASDAQEQSANISAKISNGRYDSFQVKALSADASILNLKNPWPDKASLDVQSLKLAENITFNSISAAINAYSDERYTLSIKGSGKIPSPVAFDGKTILSNLQGTLPDADEIQLTLKQGASVLRLSGFFHADELNLTASAKDYRGQDIPASLPEQLKNMRVTLDANMTGTPSNPKTELDIALKGIDAGEYQGAEITAQASHNEGGVTAQIKGSGAGIRTLNGNANFPLQLSLVPFDFSLNQNADLKGDFDADIALAPVSVLFLPPSQILTGDIKINGTLTGTLSNPTPTANLQLSNARYEDDVSGMVIADLSAMASMADNRIILSSLSATDGKTGTLNGQGSVNLQTMGADATFMARNFEVKQGDMATGVMDAALSLKDGPADNMILSGDIDIAEMHILIPERFSSNIPQLNIIEDDKDPAPSLLDKLSLAMQITAHNQFFVRGWGLDAEFGGNIDISGTAGTPQMNGVLESRRGRYEEFGKRFTLAKANLRFQGQVPPSPYLDVEATTPAGDVTGSILLTGPVTSPSISFSSTPALPEDEVLSRILFGKDSAQISPFQAIQLAQAIRRFSGQGDGGPDPLSILRDATGFDDISVEMDDTGAPQVGVGKYLSDNVYLEVGKGKAENSGEATITIEVSPSINVESRIGQDAQGGGGVFWTHDY